MFLLNPNTAPFCLQQPPPHSASMKSASSEVQLAGPSSVWHAGIGYFEGTRVKCMACTPHDALDDELIVGPSFFVAAVSVWFCVAKPFFYYRLLPPGGQPFSTRRHTLEKEFAKRTENAYFLDGPDCSTSVSPLAVIVSFLTFDVWDSCGMIGGGSVCRVNRKRKWWNTIVRELRAACTPFPKVK